MGGVCVVCREMTIDEEGKGVREARVHRMVIIRRADSALLQL